MLLVADLLCVSEQALQFARGSNFISARHTTVDTGIADLLPAADIDEYVFEPCGYSMNGLQGGAFSTIHVTPEAACSYASVELTGCMHEDVAAFVAKVRPSQFRPVMLVLLLSSHQSVTPSDIAYSACGSIINCV